MLASLHSHNTGRLHLLRRLLRHRLSGLNPQLRSDRGLQLAVNGTTCLQFNAIIVDNMDTW